MSKRSNAIKGVLVLSLIPILLIIVLAAGCSKKPASDTAQKFGDAPNFTLPKLGGGDFTLSSFKGKVIILDFWKIECPPCRMEIPGFIELYSRYKDQGLEIVGVCLDRESAVKSFAKREGMNYTLVFADRTVGQQYGGIRFVPTTFIIDRDGNIAKKHVGYVSKEAFEKEIKELLNSSAE